MDPEKGRAEIAAISASLDILLRYFLMHLATSVKTHPKTQRRPS